MDTNKINIDQYFKQSLQHFEANADDAMFDAIKEKVDNPTPSKINVDDFFKGALVNAESPVDESLFHEIKAKIDASKITVDNYFREALLDYNSYAHPIPFSEIQSKLDRDKVIDEHFKNALQNYEAKAHEEEFAVIRERVLAIQQKASRRRYAWLLLLLLIPAGLGLVGYFNQSTPVQSIEKTEPNIPLQTSNAKAETPEIQSQSPAINHSQTTASSAIPTAKTSKNSYNENAGKAANKNLVNASDKDNISNNSTTANTSTTVKENETSENSKSITTKDESSAPVTTITTEDNKTLQPNGVTETKSKEIKNGPARKPKTKYTVSAFAAAAKTGSYLNANEDAKAYVAARHASDQISTQLNFGVDLMRKTGKFQLGFGLHNNQFGQHGTFEVTKNICDSFPHRDPQGNIIGYFRINYRDTTIHADYNNTYSTLEIPFHFYYNVCNFAKFEFNIGASASLSYLVSAHGILPDAKVTQLIPIKNSLNTMHRIGAIGTVSMKLNYNISDKWQAGTELYTNSNMRSLYKKSTGIQELPFAFGMRWGLGYKF